MAPCARVKVIEAMLTNYYQVVRSPYEPPSSGCRDQSSAAGAALLNHNQSSSGGRRLGLASPDRRAGAVSSNPAGRWGQVVLELRGFVAGVQFDRFGAVWLNGVELLRLTTPEPSPLGISWSVDRDVTSYLELFLNSGELMLMVPNIVDSTYTGALEVNISFAFYAAEGSWQAPTAPTSSKAEPPATLPRTSTAEKEATAARAASRRTSFVPLRNVSKESNPLGAITVNGALGQVNLVTLPTDTVDARLELYASGHGCEEFWYSNTLTAETPAGGCGGGAYRELLVYVDGVLAGARYPFPVLYTGGVNPLLWRPLTGISSFDIPPFRFDLTVFLAWLADGQQHNITLAVFDNNPQGTWLLDGVLVLRHDDLPVQSGNVIVLESSMPQVSQSVRNLSSGETLQTMSGQHSYRIRGELVLGSGETQESEIFCELSAWSTNRNAGPTLVTDGVLYSHRGSVQDGLRVSVHENFPFHIVDSAAEDDVSMELNASIRYQRSRITTYESTSGNAGPYTVATSNDIEAEAVYNRTLAHRIVNIATSHSVENFQVYAGNRLELVHGRAPNAANNCYDRRMEASNGSVTLDRGSYTCAWTHGVYVCGGELCGGFSPSKTSQLHASGSGVEVEFATVPNVGPLASSAEQQWGRGVVMPLPHRSPRSWGRTPTRLDVSLPVTFV